MRSAISRGLPATVRPYGTTEARRARSRHAGRDLVPRSRGSLDHHQRIRWRVSARTQTLPSAAVGTDPQLHGVLVTGGAHRLGQPADGVQAQVGGERRAGHGEGEPVLALEEQDLAVPPGEVGAGADVVAGHRLRVGVVDGQQVAGHVVLAGPGQAHRARGARGVRRGPSPTPPRHSPSQSGRSNGSTSFTGATPRRRRARPAVRARPRRRSRTRAITSEMPNSTSIGMARKSIVNGSVDGVATAAKTNVPITIHGRCAPSALPLRTPASVEQDHEDRDLEGDAEDQQRADQEREVVAELDQVGEVAGRQPDQDLEALGQGEVADQHTDQEQRPGDRGEDPGPLALLRRAAPEG